MEDTTSPTLGMNRRELLKRGAVVGALTWAAPAISTLGTPAFASHGTPAGISYILLTFTCDGQTFKTKWEHDEDGFTDCNVPSNFSDVCSESLPQGWATATCDEDPPITVTQQDCEVCFTLTCDGTFIDGLAVDGAAHDCEGPTSGAGTTTMCFDDLDPDCG